MDKQNKKDQNNDLLTINQLFQQEQSSNSNQINSSIFMISDVTLNRKVKSQILRKKCQSKLFQMDMCQAINQKDINEKVKIQKNLTQSYEFQLQNIQNEIDQYNFQEYEKYKQIDQGVMQWQANIFNDINANQTSETFQKIEDIFIGYQEEGQDKYQDYVFVIMFNPTHSELQKQFQVQKSEILDRLIAKNYFLCEYLSKGGEGLIFHGYRQSIQGKLDLVFKILFEYDDEDQIQIMKLLEIYIVKFVEFIKINKNVHVLILEKCQFSLQYELFHQLKTKKDFPLEKLLKMIFNLLDGLIQFRIYNILHLDIKPTNILFTNSGKYVYTDFGMSSLKKNNQQISIKGLTKSYASPEQLNNDLNIDYQSDIYSLGKTFEIILKVFQQVQQQNYLEIISQFIRIVDEKMILEKPTQRSNCHQILNEFFQYILKQNQCQSFLKQYLDEMKEILKLYPYDKNKEIPYFLEISLFYNLNILAIQKEFIKKDNQIDIQKMKQDIAVSLADVGKCYQNIGVNQKALEYQLKSLQMRKQIFKENHLEISVSLKDVGVCYQNLGLYKQALRYLLESLQMLKLKFKYNYPSISSALNDIGLCYQNLGDIQKAQQYQLKSLQKSKQILKENHPDSAIYLSNIGLYYQNIGFYQKALEYLQESLQMTKQIYKENHPQIAQQLNNVASCYFNFDNYQKALEYFQQSLLMTKQIFKENHPLIALYLNNIGSSYLNLNEIEKALGYLFESLKIYQQIYKEKHPGIASCLNNIGICYQILCDYKKAIEYFQQSLLMTKQIFKENHPLIALYLNNIGSSYLNLNESEKALGYLLESLKLYQQIYKEKHPGIASCLNNIGICYQTLYDYKNALEYSLESLKIWKQIFNKDHPNIPSSLINVGLCFYNFGDNSKALDYLLESLQMTKQLDKENHPYITKSLDKVGLCYKNLGDYKKVLEFKLESFQIRRQMFKQNYLIIAQSLNNIGLCYLNLGENKIALEYLLESIQITKQIQNQNH
ncbi:tetratricopeptide repeat protein (macronuclear) [Tetrahymena thermophila SB210]|uniref:Tetratricopeptide repeat protein n=1 Tax=Tetrahymena thermophila (strain SB210) TaxID=312017 RepID=I7M1N5_TETTS|nr:tetratricopeptide repeat protein [Tetrahymena thermophila SB210]EAR97240.2 tetratricopeptide repeat protein [Tetrahymena thermophila SB210]|eukprot:XP_001017485.2 tetratricopeptide repeat protein [Tetrahymena thermophila SB210]